jgi:sugar phosphate isomerase/epimerase
VKPIVICDDANVSLGAAAARRYEVGLEVQQFYDPENAQDPGAVEAAERAVAGVQPLSIHGPFGDLCPGSFDAMIRETTRHRFELGWSVATRLRAQHIIFHHGYVPGTSPPPNWLRRCSGFWTAFLADKPASAQFHIENMVEDGSELLKDVIDAVHAPNVTACLDIGHAFCHSHVAPVQWVKVLGERIGYVHIHSNHGQSDEHLEPYKGTLNVAEVLMTVDQCSPEAIWALEVPLNSIEKSMEWLVAIAERL